MPRVRDSQRSKVYGWERQFHLPLSADVMTLRECKQLADRVTRYLRLSPVEVRDGRGTRRAYSYGGSIGLPKWARQPTVVLHEMAHEVMPWIYQVGRSGRAAHGREFTGVFMWLLVKFGGHDIKRLVASANDARIAFDSIHGVRDRVKQHRKRYK